MTVHLRGLHTRAARARVLAIVLAFGALAPTLAGCGEPAARTTGPAPVSRAVLTPDGTDLYHFIRSDSALVVSAPTTNRGSNLRTVFWPENEPAATDEESCAVWNESTGVSTQQGLALRIDRSGGVLRAVTVTKNIWAGVQWHFNVHVWNTASKETGILIAQFDLGAVFLRSGRVVPLPWKVCARVRGDRFSFKVWPASVNEPAWGNPAYGGSTNLPAGWVYPGRAGWYAGHLGPGNSARFTGLTTVPVSR